MHCYSAGWLSYCTHCLQSALGSSHTDFSLPASLDHRGMHLLRLLFSVCLHLLSLKPTFLPSAGGWYLIDCSITPPVTWLFLFKCCSENDFFFRQIRPISNSRRSCSELLLYFHCVSTLTRIPFFIACFILWVLEILLWIILYNWFILHNIHFSTMYYRNCGTLFSGFIVLSTFFCYCGL